MSSHLSNGPLQPADSSSQLLPLLLQATHLLLQQLDPPPRQIQYIRLANPPLPGLTLRQHLEQLLKVPIQPLAVLLLDLVMRRPGLDVLGRLGRTGRERGALLGGPRGGAELRGLPLGRRGLGGLALGARARRVFV